MASISIGGGSSNTPARTLDAPIHFSESGATVEKIAADTLVAPLAVIDVGGRAPHRPRIERPNAKASLFGPKRRLLRHVNSPGFARRDRGFCVEFE
jgi:hypothetical protein